jgi:hypothetical protein
MNISYTLSQHIGNIDIIIIKHKNTCTTFGSQKICLLIYISHPNVYNKKYIGPPAHAASRYKKLAHQPIESKRYTKIHHTIRGPLGHPQLPLPQEAVVAHPHLPQAVVVEHLQDHPAQAAGVHSSLQRAQLLAA